MKRRRRYWRRRRGRISRCQRVSGRRVRRRVVRVRVRRRRVVLSCKSYKGSP
jgi:hypothetical protein